MDLPVKIRVLGVDLTIQTANCGTSLGFFDAGAATIFLREGMNRQATKDVLLHELVHAVSHALDLGLDERTTSAVSRGLLAIVSDNPALLRWLGEQEDGHGMHEENEEGQGGRR